MDYGNMILIGSFPSGGVYIRGLKEGLGFRVLGFIGTMWSYLRGI